MHSLTIKTKLHAYEKNSLRLRNYDSPSKFHNAIITFFQISIKTKMKNFINYT